VHGPFLEVDFVEDLDAEVAVFWVGYCHGGECEGGMEMGKYIEVNLRYLRIFGLSLDLELLLK
jgi:hypothetical protein